MRLPGSPRTSAGQKMCRLRHRHARQRAPGLLSRTRGTAYFHVTVAPGVATSIPASTADGLNALHALVAALGGVVARDGRYRRRSGKVVAPSERRSLPGPLASGERVLADQGVTPADEKAGAELYIAPGESPRWTCTGSGRFAAAPEDGAAGSRRGEFLAAARPRPDRGYDRAVLDRLLREAAPVGAAVELELLRVRPLARRAGLDCRHARPRRLRASARRQARAGADRRPVTGCSCARRTRDPDHDHRL